MTEELTYESAISELSMILQELERSEVDVDVLATKVARGNELIKFCSERLEKVSQEVAEIVDSGEANKT